MNFVQEVQAAFIAIRKFYSDTDVAVELGGEDACKLNYCFRRLPPLLLLLSRRLFPIVLVFAKSDIQPLLNQGAKKEDISASIFQAVVDQTVSNPFNDFVNCKRIGINSIERRSDSHKVGSVFRKNRIFIVEL